jgi:uncharacterized protein YjbK
VTSSTEVESKFALDAADFDRLRHLAKVQRCVQQLNVYFDYAWRLANISATFRVRFSEGDPPILTLKLPVSAAGGIRVMNEFEYELSTEAYSPESVRHTEFDVDRQLPPEVGERLLGLGLNRLQYLGGMRNCRYVAEVEGIGDIELDEVVLPDGTHYYEAEIEESDLRRHQQLADWVRAAAPNARPSQLSKFQRFRDAVIAGQLAELASLFSKRVATSSQGFLENASSTAQDD